MIGSFSAGDCPAIEDTKIKIQSLDACFCGLIAFNTGRSVASCRGSSTRGGAVGHS
jgi:hypothetical protein